MAPARPLTTGMAAAKAAISPAVTSVALWVPESIAWIFSNMPEIASMALFARGKSIWPNFAKVSWALSTRLENWPMVEVDSFSIMPENCPPSLVMSLNAFSNSGKPTFPSATKSFTFVSATPRTLARL